MTKIRILLADDHAVLQAGLEAMLNAEGDMQVIGTAGDGHAAVRQAALLQPDVILLDINMPGINGLDALEQIRNQAPASRVLILTMHDDAQYLRVFVRKLRQKLEGDEAESRFILTEPGVGYRLAWQQE